MNIFRSGIVLSAIGLLFSPVVVAQYAPPVGHPGTTAMSKDSSAFIAWASTCVLDRGFINIVDTSEVYNGSNKATYGSYLYGSGPADELVASLGDQGSALLGFDIPIVNRPGPDFAIFENSFSDSFLELGFVEVSSDGQHFIRFPGISLTQSSGQVGTFDTLDATKIDNLAGKYRHGYGTPFDLEDLRDSSGIDLGNIIKVRVVDVIGCIQDPFASIDAQGHRINDPWPTPFDTGGFDFDAIGVIHNKTEGTNTGYKVSFVGIYPNPFTDEIILNPKLHAEITLKITDLYGTVLVESVFSGKTIIDLSSLPAGIYMAGCTLKDGTSFTKKIIKYQDSE